MSYILQHTTVRIDLWVILTFILLIAAIVFFAIRLHGIKKTERELEDRLDRVSGNAIEY